MRLVLSGDPGSATYGAIETVLGLGVHHEGLRVGGHRGRGSPSLHRRPARARDHARPSALVRLPAYHLIPTVARAQRTAGRTPASLTLAIKSGRRRAAVWLAGTAEAFVVSIQVCGGVK